MPEKTSDHQAVARAFWTVVLVAGGVLRGFEVVPQIAGILIIGGLIGFAISEVRAERRGRTSPRRPGRE